ncbi:hypothetical protein K505DRAFT_330610, partial [Melanomma pulvis-pyrius CBS 109.77]
GVEMGAGGLEVKEVKEVGARVKERGPRKRLGLWRPLYIGALPVGWEDDE